MIIADNIPGLGALNRLKRNTSKVSKNLQKLSSGYRINVAADDAAGLAVSEKMRLSVTGLNRAFDNCKEGVGLIQTGEGATEEIHKMLNRVKALAEQSSNGTYSDYSDRDALQKELDQIKDEIDRITKSTNFNGIRLAGTDGTTAPAAPIRPAGRESAREMKGLF
ncbi:MAG: flagellin [Oscillospiraceae bacterium]|nr:flagellin [Oscillospiraceae bacterium]